MAYVIPTAIQFKARHSKFTAVDDVLVTSMLAEAARTVTIAWAEDDYADGIMYLAAHLMVEEGLIAVAGGSTSAPNVTGPVKKMKADEVSVEFDTPGARLKSQLAGIYGSTIYGRRFIELAMRNGYGATGGAVLVV